MSRDTRLSVALHVLLHMSEIGTVTSETLGPLLKTNPVVLRRTLAGLRDAGIMRSAKGHGGGWSLARPLDAVSLGDVYDALGMSAPFNIGHRQRSPKCLLERAANRAVAAVLAEAEALLVTRFGGVKITEVLEEAGGSRAKHEPARVHRGRRSDVGQRPRAGHRETRRFRRESKHV